VLAGAATGAVSVRACWVQHHPLREAAEQQEQVTIRVELREKPRPRQGVAYGAHRAQERSIATATLRTLQRDGSPLRVGGKVVLFVPTSSWRHLIAGQQLTVTGRAVPPRAGELTVAAVQAFRPPSEVTEPPGWQRAAEDLREGLRRAADRVLSPAAAEPPGWQRAAEDLREGLRRAADRVLSPAAAGLLPGLVFGDTTALPPEVQQQFLDAGLTHLTSVSGANLAIVCGAVLFVLRGVGAGPVLSAMAGAAGLVGFVVLAGPEPSVLRAAVMGGVALLALAVGRERSALPALATSVIGLLLVRPELASRWGFALSVAATAGLVLLVPGWADALNRRGVPPGVAEALAVPAAAHLATAPLVVSFSGELSLVAVGANLLASPLVAPATVLGVLATATATALPRFADFLVWLTAPELEAVLFIGERSAAVPGAVVNWPSGLLGGLLLAAASVVLLGFLRSQRLRAVLGALVVVAVLVLVPVRTLRPHWPATDWSVVVCDVGQGDSLVLSTGVPGEAVVVDTGPAPDTTADCLRRLGVNKIPLVILTHLHADHTGGLAGVLAGRSVGAVGIGPLRKPEWALDEVLQRTRQQHVPVMTLTAGHRARWPGLDIEVLGPSGALAASRDEQDANDASLVVMATTEAGRGAAHRRHRTARPGPAAGHRGGVARRSAESAPPRIPVHVPAVLAGRAPATGGDQRRRRQRLRASQLARHQRAHRSWNPRAAHRRAGGHRRAPRAPRLALRPVAVTTGHRDRAQRLRHSRPRAALTASVLGATVAFGPTFSCTASRVFKPSPVISRTVSASGSILPFSMSFLAVATVTPPAVSAKMPSVRASSRMPSTTSSSVTSSIAPLVLRTTSST